MVWGAMIAGLALMVIGVFIKPKEAGIEFDHMWGFASNSTVAGKAVYVAGAVFLFWGIYEVLQV